METPRDINDVKRILKRCKKDFVYFCENFIKISHPLIGIIPFKLFPYQIKTVKAMQDNRFVIIKKPRQTGLSTITGVYALWLALFNSYKTILIVSRKDKDSIEFLRRNIKIPYRYLPDWFKSVWGDLPTNNEHEIGFKNGSIIRSLTSHKDVIRSNASSFTILDEVAFMPDMDEMWSAGYPSMIHGGSCVVISTVGSINNWYWRSWQDAINQESIFHPVNIEWYEMDWEIAKDDLIISPIRDIRPCRTESEKKKYGKYVSPWLEQQYKALVGSDGDEAKFKREILGQFVGTGKAVISDLILEHYYTNTVKPPLQKIETVDYRSHNNSVFETLNFNGDLWIWRFPTKIDKFSEKHYVKEKFVMGVDVSTGEGIDYSAIQVIDIINMEQVAEWKGYTRPKYLAYMADFIGRMYNNALMVVERTGIGFDTVQELYLELSYPNMYLERRKNAMMAYTKRKRSLVGFNTTGSTKPLLVKTLLDNINQDGYIIRSTRLLNELSIFSYLSNNRIGAEPGKGNHDDLVMAMALALYGVKDALMGDPRKMMIAPSRYQEDEEDDKQPIVVPKKQIDKKSIIVENMAHINMQSNFKDEQDKFIMQLGAAPIPVNNFKVIPDELRNRINAIKKKRM